MLKTYIPETIAAIVSNLLGLAIQSKLGFLTPGISKISEISILNIAEKNCSLRELVPFVCAEHDLSPQQAKAAILAGQKLLEHSNWNAQALRASNFNASNLVSELPFELEYSADHNLRSASHTSLRLVTEAALEKGELIQAAAPALFAGLHFDVMELRKDVSDLQLIAISAEERERKLELVLKDFDRAIHKLPERFAEHFSPLVLQANWLERQSNNCEKCFGKQALSSCYVPLFAEGAEYGLKEVETEWNETETNLYRDGLLQIVSSQTITVLTGDPGSGKSSFAQHLCLVLQDEQRLKRAVAAEKKLLEDILESSRNERDGIGAFLKSSDANFEALVSRVPVYLRASVLAQCLDDLGEYCQWAVLLGAYFREIYRFSEVECEQLGHQLFAQACFVVIDGLDEVRSVHVLSDRRGQQLKRGDDMRSKLVDWLNGLHGLSDWKSAKFLITSRPYGYRDSPLISLSNVVPSQPLAPLLLQQQQRLGQLALGISGKGERFSHTLEQMPDAQRTLLSRPLILGLAIDIFDSYQVLPSDKAGLYEACVDLFLQRWPKRRFDQGGAGENSMDEQEERFKILAEALENDENLNRFRDEISGLARRTHVSDLNGADSSNITRQSLAECGANFAFHARLSIDVKEDFCDYLAWHTGLLIERRTGEVYAFAHRSFQEYLAACDFLVSERDATELALELLRNPDQWRNVFLLAVGIARSGNSVVTIKVLISALLEAAETSSIPERFHALVVVVVALDEMIEEASLFNPEEGARLVLEPLGLVSRILRDSVIELLSFCQRQNPDMITISATDAAAAGRLLGLLGDTRVGVGVKDGLPAIEWLPVVVPKNWRRCDWGGDSLLSADPSGPLYLQDFFISHYLITHTQFEIFSQDPTNCQFVTDYAERDIHEPIRSFGQTIPNHPRVFVSWDQAMGFCSWLTSRLRAKGELDENNCIRLPTEWEWLFAASNSAPTKITTGSSPWSGKVSKSLANYTDSREAGENLGRATAVGIYPTPEGYSNDLLGNVWTWCLNGCNYSNAEQVLNLSQPQLRAMRGGSFHPSSGICNLGSRYDNAQNFRSDTVGFCVVRSPILSNLKE